jgi:threonine/homoserine/homoserine lactone efflux protein
VLEAALAGAVAGYAIAIPVGAIAVLIIQTGFRHGFGTGLAAAAGAASADGIYATIAALAGLAVTSLIGPLIFPLRLVGGFVLIGIGMRGLIGLRDRLAGGEALRGLMPPRSRFRTYIEMLGLTLLNPATIIYFAALTVGLPFLGGFAERSAFVIAAFIASLSWQVLLAAFGATLGRGAGRRLHVPTMIVGNLIIIGFGVLVLAGGLQPAT